jgi:hypothetical protein
LEEANRFLREHYILPRRGRNLDLTFSLQFERAVNRDNTVSFQHLRLQIEPVRWRATLPRERREFFKGSSRVAKVIGNPPSALSGFTRHPVSFVQPKIS